MNRNRFTNARYRAETPKLGTIADSYNTIKVSYHPADFGYFNADLYDYIENANQMSEIIDAMDMMSDKDIFTLRISSGGGCASTTDALVHAIRRCKGTVKMIATGDCASAATIILLEAHEFELSDNFTALIHCGSLGEGGTLAEFNVQAPFRAKKFEQFIRNSYAGFLTDKELDQLIAGKDFVMDAEEWVERAENRNEWFQEQVEKLRKAAEKALKPPKKPRKKKVEGNVPTPQYDPDTVAFKGLETAFDEDTKEYPDYLAPPKV